jgi:hypothetical protein
MPFGKSVGIIWKLGIRHEAGMILLHISGRIKEASETVKVLSRIID